MQIAKRRQFIIGAAAAVLVIFVAGVVVAIRSAQPKYEPVGNGLALGPAVRHSPAPTDIAIQIATGALSAAAGNAVVDRSVSGELVLNAQEQALLDLTNADRASNGLAPVAFDPASLQVARVRAAAQIPDGPLSHYNNLGELAFVGMLADAGVAYALAGENLARASSQDTATVARLNDALMHSPTHRANILEPSFDRVAVGAATGPDGRIALAEIFRSSLDQLDQ